MAGLAEGEVLADRYRLGPAAGHGAMGEVHLAEDLRLARPVAIKSLRPELARYPEVRDRFGHEAKAAARISHPNVVRVYDSGEQDGIPYLVMECLPGTSLADELAWGPIDPRRARRVGLDVLGALDAAHRLGVVHRDVKPGNILSTATIDGPVKVSDFGIAKSADDQSLSDSNGLVGTAAYLAPERVAGEPASPASDLYSVGVVLFESLAGRKPHEGETALALALAIHMEEAPSLGQLRPDLDPALVAVIDKALARDPAERWASAAEMGEALRAWRPPATRSDPDSSPPAAARAAASAAFAAASAAAAAAPAATVALPAEALPTTPRRWPAAVAGRGTAPPGRPEAEAGGSDPAPGRPPLTARLRSRTALLGIGAAGLLVVLVVAALTTLRGSDVGEPAAPPPAVVGSAPTTTVAPGSVTPTTAPPATRAARPRSGPASTAAPTTRRTTTSLRATTTRPTTTTTLPAATTTLAPVPPPVAAAASGAGAGATRG